MGTAPRKSGNGNRVCQTGGQTCRRPVGSARPPTAAPARSARAVTRQGRWGHFGAEKDDAVAHAGRRRVALGAGCSQASAFPGELLARRGGSLYLSLSRSVHLSLTLSRIGPHLATGFFFFLLASPSKAGAAVRDGGGGGDDDVYARDGARHRCPARGRRDGRTASAVRLGRHCWSNGEKNSPPPSAACRARSVHPSMVASLPQRHAVSWEV